jgi:serine/threonine-protein kinase
MIAGKYELDSLIGEGGMGTVWRARNVALDAPVAIKVVRSTGDRALLSGRLMQEARAAAKLAHPAIVKVFDIGQTEAGDPFIVMELLQGTSLGEVLERDGRLPAVQAVRLMLPIADALWLAHEKGIVHRDLKPDNVFIVQQEGSIQPTLVDFGIVKVEETGSSSHLTKAGDVLGSPDYMSPEQARGLDHINHLTDVWSFCIVLYELITGDTPFDGTNYNALLRQIVEATPVTLLERSMADAELSAIVARGLSKQPEQRYASMGELGRALASWLLAQGFSEDICGTSLEAKWLRAADQLGRAGRGTLGSFADWPIESGSGVRRNVLTPQVTIPAPPDVPAAASTAPPAATPAARRNRWALIAGGGVLLLAGIAWAALRGAAAPDVPTNGPSASAVSGAGSAAALPAVSAPSVTIAPAPAPEEKAETAQAKREAVSSASGRVPAVKTGGAKPAVRPPPPGGPPPRPSAGTGDLLSPY